MSSGNLIPLNDALNDAIELCQKFNFTPDQIFWFENAILNSNPVIRGNDYYISTAIYETLLKNFIVSCQEKDLGMMRRPRGYKVRPVDMEEFIESRAFLGQKGFIRPIIKKELLSIASKLDSIREVVLTGSVGQGKSYMSRILMSYLLYRDSCLVDVQSEYSLSPGSSILYVIQAVSLTVAKRAIFGELRSMLQQSPYFTKHFPFNKRIGSELRFPNSLAIIPVSSSEMSSIGLNVKAVHMTECNYMAVIEDSRLSSDKDNNIYDQAEVNYTTLSQRMKSRFGTKGLMILDSAVNYPGDFLSRRAKEAEYNNSIYVMKYAHWETLPKGSVSEETFLVEVGTPEYNSRILVKREEAHPNSQIIEVPINYLIEFKRNCDKALRDFAGISVAMEGSFLTDREKITQAIKVHTDTFGQQQLFTKDDIIIDAELDPNSPDWGCLINQEYLAHPSFDEAATYVMHLDLGISKDATGIAIGHIHDYVDMPSTTQYNDSAGTFVDLSDLKMPVCCIDGLLRVRPPHGGQVHLDLLRGFLYYLCQVVNVKIATADQFESTNFIQGLIRLKVKAGRRSTVSTSVPFKEWKQCYLENRIIHPHHSGYLDEIYNLQYDPVKDKIDHPSGGKKDLADAAAIVINLLHHKVALSTKTLRTNKAEAQKPVRRIGIKRGLRIRR